MGAGGQVVSATYLRDNLKAVFDRVHEGVSSSVDRGSHSVVLVDGAKLRHTLKLLLNLEPVMVFEEGEWALFFPGLPVSASGASVDEAIADGVVALREYADDWEDHLRTAPNHEVNWGLVQFLNLSSDSELAHWIAGEE